MLKGSDMEAILYIHSLKEQTDKNSLIHIMRKNGGCGKKNIVHT